MHYLQEKPRRIDRTRVFLGLMLLLCLWDVAYFVGLRNPYSVPHPFSLFRALGDVEFLRGFSAMLREVIFSFVSGSVIGIAVGALLLFSSSLSGVIRRFLRIMLWFPIILTFAVPASFVLAITAVALCACHYYIAARSLLDLKRSDAWIYASREALLQAVLVSLINQMWVSHWQWSTFPMFMKVGPGIQVFATLVCLIGFINWCFQSDFQLTADIHATMITQELEREKASSLNRVSVMYALTLVAVAYLAISLVLGSAEIWGHVGLSLLEVIGGVGLGGLAAQGTFVVLSRKARSRKLLFSMLPLTHISAIVLWLIVFVLWATWFRQTNSTFLYFWHKAIAVGFLTFFPLVQSLWGFRDRPIFYRVLLAIDDALPIAFVAMFFGEAYAATQGLGFFTVVARATHHSDQAIAACFVTFVLILGLSVLLRWAAKALYFSEKTAQVVPA
jgi:ABC-type nitrate/sulfonate/bicarbonate transport system permease component